MLEVLSSSDSLTAERTVTALGIFDGVHRGHRAVIGVALEQAKKCGCAPAVFTFQASTVSTKGGRYRPIYGDSDKCALLGGLGVEYMYMPDFAGVRDMGPEEFALKILKGKMNAAEAVCGMDFRFGKGAACGTEELADICGALGIKVTAVKDVSEDGVKISSADIRRLISEGKISRANKLLGRDYTIKGEVVRGRQLGRTLDFPTANQRLREELVMPAFGVYVSEAEIDGITYRGVTNIGVKPTVRSGGEPLAETYFIGFEGSLYGRELSLRLMELIREERKFSDINALKEQIAKDAALARRYGKG